MEQMIDEAEQVAAAESEYMSYEDVVVVVIMAGTRENFYDQLKQYMRKMK